VREGEIPADRLVRRNLLLGILKFLFFADHAEDRTADQIVRRFVIGSILGEGGQRLPEGSVLHSAIGVLAHLAETEQDLKVVESATSNAETFARPPRAHQYKSRADQPEQGWAFLSRAPPAERLTHCLEGGIRSVGFFDVNIDLRVGNLLDLCAHNDA